MANKLTKTAAKSKDVTSTVVVVTALRKKAKPILNKLPDVITTKAEYELAAANMKVVKSFAKEAEETKKQLIDPLNDVIKGIKELFAPFEQEVKGAETTLKLQMSIFLEDTKKKLKQIENDLDSGKIKKVTTAISKQNAITINSGIRKVWKAIPVDVAETPREYLMPDEKAIAAALKDGKSVRGWLWKKVDQIVI